MSPSRPQLRGLALKNDLDVLRDLHGEVVADEIIAQLPAPYRAMADVGFLPSSWYAEAIQAELCALLIARFGDAECLRLGVAAAHRTIKRWHRFIARIVGPERLLVRAPGMWSYWRDSGRVSVENQTPHGIDQLVEDNAVFAAAGNAECYGAGAAFMVAATGGRNVQLCVERPAPATVRGRVRWDAAAEGPGWHDIDRILVSLPSAYRE